MPRTPVVTAINERYFPGLKALHNSFRANAGPGFDFYCIVDGDDALLERVRGLGVTAIPQPDWGVLYPTSAEWPEVIPAMYSRLLIPRLFDKCHRALWLDADCIVTDSLAPLLEIEFDQVVACPAPDSAAYAIDYHVPNCGKTGRAPLTAVMLFNVRRWNAERITQQCAEAMNLPLNFRYAVQSVLAYVLNGKFYHLDERWHGFANRPPDHFDPITEKTRILHWIGGIPWEKKMENQQLWDRYA